MKEKKHGPVFRIVCLILICLVIGLNIYIWNAQTLAGNAMPMPFGYGAAVVMSGSMEPAIMVDELIIVRAAEEYAVGDVVVYQNGTVPVVHRIVAIDGGVVTTRGDANNVDDEPLTISLIKGKVILHIPHVGAVMQLMKTPLVTILLIVAAVLMVELPYRKEKEKNDKQLEWIKAEIRLLKEQQDS